MNELNTLHKDHQVEVPRRVWNQIEGKINQERQRKKFTRLRMFTGIAACFIIASIFSYLRLEFVDHNPQVFATNEAYKSMIWEDLEESNSALYDFEQVLELKSAIIASEPSFGRRNR